MNRPDRPGPISSYAVLVVAYFALLFLLPANKMAMSQYHLNAATYHVLLAIVEIPLIAMWLAAFYGFTKFRQYTLAISKTAEGSGFRQLTEGFRWLALTLVLPPSLSLILNGFANSHANFHPSAIIITNYASLIFPLIAFTYMATGAESLLAHGRHLPSLTKNLKVILGALAILGATFCMLAFQHVNLRSMGDANNAYYLPTWLLVFTVVVPYLYTWYVGLTATFEINALARHAKGLLYRQGLGLVAKGIALVIFSSIASQFLQATIPRKGHVSLNSALLLIYVLYVVIILGFVFISYGASRLKKIEDI